MWCLFQNVISLIICITKLKSSDIITFGQWACLHKISFPRCPFHSHGSHKKLNFRHLLPYNCCYFTVISPWLTCSFHQKVIHKVFSPVVSTVYYIFVWAVFIVKSNFSWAMQKDSALWQCLQVQPWEKPSQAQFWQ